MRKNFWDTEHFKKKLKGKNYKPKPKPKKHLKSKLKKYREYNVGEFIILIVSVFLIGVFCYFSYLVINNFFQKKIDRIESPKPPLEEKDFENQTNDWQVYDNSAFNYQLKLPKDAKKEELNTGEGANFTLMDGLTIKTWAQKNESGDTINIAIENERVEAMTKDKKIKITENRNESLSGMTALSQTWNYYDNNLKKDAAEKIVVAAASGNLYFIDFIAPIKEFEEQQKNFDLVIQSLKVL